MRCKVACVRMIATDALGIHSREGKRMDDLKAYRELRVLWNKYRLINADQAAAIEHAMNILAAEIMKKRINPKWEGKV